MLMLFILHNYVVYANIDFYYNHKYTINAEQNRTTVYRLPTICHSSSDREQYLPYSGTFIALFIALMVKRVSPKHSRCGLTLFIAKRQFWAYKVIFKGSTTTQLSTLSSVVQPRSRSWSLSPGPSSVAPLPL